MVVVSLRRGEGSGAASPCFTPHFAPWGRVGATLLLRGTTAGGGLVVVWLVMALFIGTVAPPVAATYISILCMLYCPCMGASCAERSDHDCVPQGSQAVSDRRCARADGRTGGRGLAASPLAPRLMMIIGASSPPSSPPSPAEYPLAADRNSPYTSYTASRATSATHCKQHTNASSSKAASNVYLPPFHTLPTLTQCHGP